MSGFPDYAEAVDRRRVAPAVRSDLSIDAQVQAGGATWLDRQLLNRIRGRAEDPAHLGNYLDRRHFHATAHPIIEGYDPPEGWGWCYVDEVMLSDRATPQDGPIRRYY